MARRTLNINRIRLQHHRKMIAYERKYAKLILIAIEKDIKPVLSDFNHKVEHKHLLPVLVDLYEDLGVHFATDQYRILESFETKADGFFLTTWRKWMGDYAKSVLSRKIVEITTTTMDKINNVLARSLEEGLTRGETAKRIEEVTGGEIGYRRARVIARTEGNTAANEGKERSAEDWGKERKQELYKIWIHSYSKGERASHVALDNGKAIPKNQPFYADGEAMQKPMDENASAGNVINCNCIVTYVSERYAKRVNSR